MIESYHTPLPVIFTCSGNCENAEFANDLAKVMDIEGLAQRCSIAELAQSDTLLDPLQCHIRQCMAIDGCQQQCVKHALAQLNTSPTWHLILSDFTDNKGNSANFDYAQMAHILKKVQAFLT